MNLENLPARLVGLLAAVYRAEPARVISAAAAVVVFVLARAHVVVPEQSVVHAIEFALPFLLVGEATRTQVSPVPVDDEPADAPGVPAT